MGRGNVQTAFDHVWAATSREDAVDQSVISFLKCGAAGAYPANIERDLFRSWLVDCGLHVDLDELLVEFEATDKAGAHTLHVSIIPPYQIVAALAEQGPQVFYRALVGNEGRMGLANWWQAAMEDECFATHPDLQGGADLSHTFPLMVFIDGAEVQRNNEYTYCLWRSATVYGEDPADYVFPFCAVPTVLVRRPAHKDKLMEVIAERWAYEMNAIIANEGPWVGFYSEDFAIGSKAHALRGQSLNSFGFRGVFAGNKHDAKARKEVHRFKHGSQSTFICDCCCAIQSFPRAPAHLNFTDFGESPGWIATRITNEMYLALTEPKDLSPWVCVSGWRKELLWWDGLHNEGIGFLRDLIPAVSCSWIGYGVFGHDGTFDEKAMRMQADMVNWCRGEGIRCPTGRVFSRTTFGQDKDAPNSKYPELSSTYKAASIKTIAYYLAYKARVLLAEFRASNVQKLIAGTVLRYGEWLYVCDICGPVFTSEERWRAYNAGMMHLRLYGRLALMFQNLGIRLFKCRPKQHYFHEVLLRLRTCRLNPRHLQNAAEETMLGRLKRVGVNTHKFTTSRRILQRHLLHLGMRWRRQRRDGTWHVRTAT